jgi:hypothetical protein
MFKSDALIVSGSEGSSWFCPCLAWHRILRSEAGKKGVSHCDQNTRQGNLREEGFILLMVSEGLIDGHWPHALEQESVAEEVLTSFVTDRKQRVRKGLGSRNNLQRHSQ